MWFVVPALLLAGAVVLYLRAWIAEERILRRQGGDHEGSNVSGSISRIAPSRRAMRPN